MKYTKSLLGSIIILTIYQHSFSQKQNFNYLVNAQSLNGCTGNITTPSPYTTEYKKFSLGLHRFNIGVNYGLIKFCEIGINLDLKELIPSTEENFEKKLSSTTAIHTKYHILRQYPEGNLFDFAIGIHRKNFYMLLNRQFSNFFDIVIEAGIDTNLEKEKKVRYFLSLAKPTKYSYFIIDYRSNLKQTNIGWRVLLSPDVKLDLFIIKIEKIKNIFDNFVFGLTLTS